MSVAAFFSNVSWGLKTAGPAIFPRAVLPRAALLAGAALSLTACTVPGMLVGAGAAVGIGAAQERGLETAADDLSIQLAINRHLLEQDGDLFADIATQVSEGRVLMTGVVEKPEDRVAAVRLAWSVKAVREVISEIRVAEGESLVRAAKDTAISAKLRSRLMRDTVIDAINYSIETVRGTVYLMGIARSERELTRAINHVRDIAGVRNVISHVQLKNDPARRDQDGAASTVIPPDAGRPDVETSGR